MKLALVNPTLVAGDSAENARRLRALLEPLRGELGRNDIALLPEHWFFDGWEHYLAESAALAVCLGCHLVAGSLHRIIEGGAVNAGAVLTPEGDTLGTYSKLRPYAAERRWVQPGQPSEGFEIGARRVAIMVCADFWFTDLFLQQAQLPDLVVVPALSVTRKPSPAYSQRLWQHTAVARAYEYGIFVGISDWAVGSTLPRLPASGVSGFADPTAIDPEQLFRAVDSVSLVDLDFARLEAFRHDRRSRGFFWDGPREGTSRRGASE